MLAVVRILESGQLRTEGIMSRTRALSSSLISYSSSSSLPSAALPLPPLPSSASSSGKSTSEGSQYFSTSWRSKMPLNCRRCSGISVDARIAARITLNPGCRKRGIHPVVTARKFQTEVNEEPSCASMHCRRGTRGAPRRYLILPTLQFLLRCIAFGLNEASLQHI